MTLGDVVSDYFLNRTDRLANLAPWGRPCPIDATGCVDKIIGAHLGEATFQVKHLPSNGGARKGAVSRVGSYTPDVQGLTRWVCIDLDGKDHADGLENPLHVAERIFENLHNLGFPAHLERSGGGRGFHVWVFFDKRVQAIEARRVAFSAVPQELRQRALSNRGVEIFPKTNDPVGQGLGHMVWLPWWAGAPQDCGMFYRPSEQGWESYLPTGFDRADSGRWSDLAKSLAPKKGEPPQPTRGAQRQEEGTSWRDWRSRVTQALDLSIVYGHLLTGKKAGKGWLQCRLADREDPHPSAGVADTAREAERGTYHEYVTGRSLRLIDFMLEYGQARDVGDANAKLAEWTGIPTPVARSGAQEPPKAPPPTEAPPKPPRPAKRPTVVVNGRQIRDVIKDGWDALLVSETPKIYVRNNELVRIRQIETGKRIEPMTRDATHGALLRSATWVKVKQSSENGSYYVDDKPQSEIAADMLSYPHPSLPRLEVIVRAPTFAHDGRLISAPGFDEESGVYYDEIEEVRPVPEKPSQDDVQSARMFIEEDLFVDFPWTNRADKASAWCALLVPFVRRMIPGSTPLHLIEAPVAGSGKSLLADLICLTFLGQVVEVTMLPTDEEETRKKMTSLLRAGKPIITFDNLPHGSKSATLAAMITSSTWSDRKLGSQEMLEMRNRAVWITTVNNPDFSVDLARRCVRIRIAPVDGRPWERAKFKHKNIRGWVKKHRSEVVHAILTLIQYWVSIGMPRGERSLGSFESWSQILGGILDHIGIPGFLENTKDLYDQADTDSAEWAEFVRVWWAMHHDEPTTAKTLVELAKTHDLLLTVRGDRGPSSQSIRMGKALSRMRGRVVDGWRIDMGMDSHSKSRDYRLEPLTEQAREPLYIRELLGPAASPVWSTR